MGKKNSEDQVTFTVLNVEVGEAKCCFICRGKEKATNRIMGIAADPKDADAIVEMFDGAANWVYGADEAITAYVKIGSCEKHFPHLKALAELSGQGTISRGLIGRAMGAITQEEFHHRVEMDAFFNWKLWEQTRRHENWMAAIGQLETELGRCPHSKEIQHRAEQLFEERKEKDALIDWEHAHQALLARHVII